MQMSPQQFQMITNQFATLKERSAFYAKKFDGIDLGDIKSQADFEKLPFTEKADLREAYPLGIAAVPPEKIVRIHSSSGTTGTPVIIPYTAKDVARNAEVNVLKRDKTCYTLHYYTTAEKAEENDAIYEAIKASLRFA